MRITRIISFSLVLGFGFSLADGSSTVPVTITITCAPTSPSSTAYDFGSCSNPGIQYGYDIDDSENWGYAPADQDQFPHAWSPDVATVESYICTKLEIACNADAAAVAACRSAFASYSGLAGDVAVEAWNTSLGLTGQGSCPGGEGNGWLTTTTTTVTYGVGATLSTIYESSSYPSSTARSTSTSSSPKQISGTLTLTETKILGSAMTTTIMPSGPSQVLAFTTITTVVTEPQSSASSISGKTGNGGGSPFDQSNIGASYHTTSWTCLISTAICVWLVSMIG